MFKISVIIPKSELEPRTLQVITKILQILELTAVASYVLQVSVTNLEYVHQCWAIAEIVCYITIVN